MKDEPNISNYLQVILAILVIITLVAGVVFLSTPTPPKIQTAVIKMLGTPRPAATPMPRDMAKIIDVHRSGLGLSWETLVEYPDGYRIEKSGKPGERGEIIRIKHSWL